jgi:membrane-bound serine protease (ClpP class)
MGGAEIQETASASSASPQSEGWARIHSEQWRVRSPAPIKRGQSVRVTARSDLILSVLPVTEADQGA